MPSPIGRTAQFEILSDTRPQNPAQLVYVMQRIDRLTQLAFKLGVHSGCRVRDDVNGLEFRWRLMP